MTDPDHLCAFRDKLCEALGREQVLRDRLEQIAIVCTDNMDRSCDHRMALDFVRQIANTGHEQKAGPEFMKVHCWPCGR